MAVEVEEVEVLHAYPEGRVVLLSDGSVRVEGVYDDPAAPMTGRYAMVAHPDPPPQSVASLAGMTLKGQPIRYVERQPWERPAPKPPSEAARKLEAEEEARRRAYDDFTPERRRPEPEAGPSVEELRAAVARKARDNAEVVYRKWMGQ